MYVFFSSSVFFVGGVLSVVRIKLDLSLQTISSSYQMA